MFLLPLLTYYIALPRVGGSSTWAGGLAALSANVVLIGYVVAAFLEDDGMGASASGRTGAGEAGRQGSGGQEKSADGAVQVAQDSSGGKKKQ